MNDTRNETAYTIENIVCDFFSLPIEEVFSKTLNREMVIVRHITIYILHKIYKLSVSFLAKRYDCSTSLINKVCANITNYIEYDKKFRNQYNCLLRYAKDKGEL